MDEAYQLAKRGIAGHPLTNANTLPGLHTEGYPLQDFRPVEGVPSRQVGDIQIPVFWPSVFGLGNRCGLGCVLLFDDQILLDTLETIL